MLVYDGIKSYMNDFNKLIGWKNIILFHINDSKYDLNTKKDFHTGIGNGFIFNTKQGINALKYIKTFCIQYNIPMVLETHKTLHNYNDDRDDGDIRDTGDTEDNSKGIGGVGNINVNTGFTWEIQYIKNL